MGVLMVRRRYRVDALAAFERNAGAAAWDLLRAPVESSIVPLPIRYARREGVCGNRWGNVYGQAYREGGR
jgi:hypothetical protein